LYRSLLPLLISGKLSEASGQPWMSRNQQWKTTDSMYAGTVGVRKLFISLQSLMIDRRQPIQMTNKRNDRLSWLKLKLWTPLAILDDSFTQFSVAVILSSKFYVTSEISSKLCNELNFEAYCKTLANRPSKLSQGFSSTPLPKLILVYTTNCWSA
jgi:hypothetical protein